MKDFLDFLVISFLFLDAPIRSRSITPLSPTPSATASASSSLSDVSSLFLPSSIPESHPDSHHLHYQPDSHRPVTANFKKTITKKVVVDASKVVLRDLHSL